MKLPIALLALLALAACGGGGGGTPAKESQGPRPPAPPSNPFPPDGDPAVFRVLPYLQMGANPDRADRMDLLWISKGPGGAWEVQARTAAQGPWKSMAPPVANRVAVPAASTPAHWVWSTTLKPLDPGSAFDYRVLFNGAVVFTQTGVKARPGPGQAQRVAMVGDMVEGGSAEIAIARQIHAYRPDYVVAAGDMVYRGGTIDAYQTYFFPAYNAARASSSGGAPLLGSTLMVGVLGNNDMADADRTKAPAAGGPGYFLYWNQPLNGPHLTPGGHVPPLQPASAWQDFRQAAGNRYPDMGNFSFTAGDAHWTILDSNFYINWGNPGLQTWLRQDLAAAQAAKWRIVVFHHPCFNLGSVELGWRQYRMRQLWPIFQQENVDLVVSGHIHSYQRTRPLRFQPQPTGVSAERHFLDPASLIIDTQFDGVTHTRAQGPIQIVTGGGGSHKHGIRRPTAGPRPLDAALVGDRHSFSTFEIQGGTLVFRQLDDQGHPIDTFTLTK